MVHKFKEMERDCDITYDGVGAYNYISEKLAFWENELRKKEGVA